MTKKILVPLDGSPLAENALTVALQLAKTESIVIHLIRAVREEIAIAPSPVGSPTIRRPHRTLSQITESGYEYLNQFKGPDEDRSIITEVSFGDPAELILNTAVEKECDMIIMSTHGRSGLNRWLYGSVTEKVLRHADCPVLAVRSPDLPKRFLVTLDRSQFSEAILEPAITLADSFGAKIVLAHVQDNRQEPPWGNLSGTGLETDGFADLMTQGFYHRGQDYLEGVANRYRDLDVEFDVAYGNGNPADYILNLADNDQCDLIAMSTHGRGGISRFRFGSVTEKVLRHNNRAMLIVHNSDD